MIEAWSYPPGAVVIQTENPDFADKITRWNEGKPWGYGVNHFSRSWVFEGRSLTWAKKRVERLKKSYISTGKRSAKMPHRGVLIPDQGGVCGGAS